MSPNALEIVSITENQDGSADIEVNVTDEFVDYYKRVTGKKRVHVATLRKFVDGFVAKALMSCEDRSPSLVIDSLKTVCSTAKP